MRNRLAAFLPVFLCSLATAEPIVIDGEFADWDAIPPTFTDASDDHTGVFDVTDVWITSDAQRISVSADVGTAAHNLQAGDYPFSQGIRFTLIFDGSPIEAISIDTRPHLIRVTEGGSSSLATTQEVGLGLLPTHASSRYEFSLPRSFVPGATSARFATTGSDDVLTPFIPLSDTPRPTLSQSFARAPGTGLRVASINTLNRGMRDPERRDAFVRLIRAADADVYCIQEEYRSISAPADAAALRGVFSEAIPLTSRASWHYARSDEDTWVFSRHPVVFLPLPFQLRLKDAGVFIDRRSAGRGLAYVTSIHPPCCGHSGNHSDQSRIAELSDIVDIIADIRSGIIEASVPGSSSASAIVAGDWNLVGSRVPLNRLESNLGMTAPPLPDLATRSNAITWRDPDESPGQFFPGRLDLIAHDPQRLEYLNGFVIDSEALTPAARAASGLLPEDSLASDHLMLVADYAFIDASADLNADGVVDALDLAIILAGWGAPGPADLTGDAIVDSFDLAVLLAGWD